MKLAVVDPGASQNGAELSLEVLQRTLAPSNGTSSALAKLLNEDAAAKSVPSSTTRLVLWWKLTSLALSEMPILMPNCESWANLLRQ